jgi:hypothetical protein
MFRLVGEHKQPAPRHLGYTASRLESSRVGACPGPCSPDAPRPEERALCAPLLISPIISRSAPRPATWETSISEGGKYGWEMADPILPTACDFHVKCRDFLHAANLRHGTDGFTSSPREGTRWRSWLRLCATSRKVASSIPESVIGIFSFT